MHLSLVKQFHFDIKLCTVYLFLIKFQLHILRHCGSIKPDKYLLYLWSIIGSIIWYCSCICYICATVPVEVLIFWNILWITVYLVWLWLLEISFAADSLLMIIHLFCDVTLCLGKALNIHSVMWAAFSTGGLITWPWVDIKIYF